MKLSASKPKDLCTLRTTPRAELFVSWCVWRNKQENDSSKRLLLSISFPHCSVPFLLSFVNGRKSCTTSGRMTNIWREIVIARHLFIWYSKTSLLRKKKDSRRKENENENRKKRVRLMSFTYIEGMPCCVKTDARRRRKELKCASLWILLNAFDNKRVKKLPAKLKVPRHNYGLGIFYLITRNFFFTHVSTSQSWYDCGYY